VNKKEECWESSQLRLGSRSQKNLAVRGNWTPQHRKRENQIFLHHKKKKSSTGGRELKGPEGGTAHLETGASVLVYVRRGLLVGHGKGDGERDVGVQSGRRIVTRGGRIRPRTLPIERRR